MATYATRQYARLSLDTYIEGNRESDETAKRMTDNQPTLVYLGAAQMPANRPFGIKNRKRCPGTRKLVISLKKLGNCYVLFVDEYFTSQTCANCFERFLPTTRRDRFKVCRDCKPILNMRCAELPTKVVTERSKKEMKARREAVKCLLRTERRAVALSALLGANPIEPITHNRFKKFGRLASKVAFYRKNWRLNGLNVGLNYGLNNAAVSLPSQQQQQTLQQLLRAPVGSTVVWHRDIVAARCIMYKGMHKY